MNHLEYSHSIINPTNNLNHFSKHLENLKNETISLEIDSSILHIVKMTFIYSAIMDGWRVEKLSNNKFIFSKKNITKHITLQSFINKHLHSHNLK